MDDILRVTPGNPMPPNATAGYFEGYRGAKLRYALFRSDISPAAGTVVLLQGRNEFIEKYYETIRDLNAMGLWVATFDLRGQGGSDRLTKDPRKGHVRRFRDYERDLEIFLEKIVLPDARMPFFLIGHSTGALIALSAGPRLGNRISRMALLGPYIGFQNQEAPEAVVRPLSALLSWTGLGHVSLGKDKSRLPFENNGLTRDPRRFERNTEIIKAYPDLTVGAPTARWVHETLSAARRVSRQTLLTEITIPTLILAPVLDGVVPYALQEELSRNFRAAQLVTITGGRHEILQEKDIYRAQALAAFQAFMPGEDGGLDLTETAA
ncbi:alpha/beta hydrolase [Rhizobium sp. LC145]|uniref:alpha/beta fold hydrolase n=1 Tax=Rhizobium sp. LC145 TaxID=1120688 RepID=UPI000629FB47|nr:alpha/beta hydrolase [Rhizobium sp. LC145]KKX30472.1 lysophospholipase [Rhizobium sp. LC145]TKT43739.1 alpha/beta hydrolase [Rhizobiaceae bacterium LC148]